ncbi:MAG: hypothetical protein EBV86_01260 [Marivivens sp.]|nr:hypothetical protein [Marivivens sp.]NBT49964.1 hypothetical protein [Marivivens sp.]NCW67184.1 hypothetical protein [Marivivens sp.]
MRRADEVMREMLETFEQRGALYKDNYLLIGQVLEVIFPDGVQLLTQGDHNRYHLFIQCLNKLLRLAMTDLSHQDSAHDLAVYAAMLEGLLE